MPKKLEDEVHITSLRFLKDDYESAREIIEKMPGNPTLTSFCRGVIRDVSNGEYVELSFLPPEYMKVLKAYCKKEGITIQHAVEPLIRDMVKKLRDAALAENASGKSR